MKIHWCIFVHLFPSRALCLPQIALQPQYPVDSAHADLLWLISLICSNCLRYESYSTSVMQIYANGLHTDSWIGFISKYDLFSILKVCNLLPEPLMQQFSRMVKQKIMFSPKYKPMFRKQSMPHLRIYCLVHFKMFRYWLQSCVHCKWHDSCIIGQQIYCVWSQ